MNAIHKYHHALSSVKLFSIALVLAASSHAAVAAGERGPANAGAKPPIVLQSTGAYEVGGKIISNPADPKRTLSCDHGYVEYFIPARPHARPASSCGTGSSTKVFENRWDGGEGYKSMFLRKRYPVYLWDGPRVGRANWRTRAHQLQTRVLRPAQLRRMALRHRLPQLDAACSFRPTTRKPGTRLPARATTSSTRSTTPCCRPRPAARPSTKSGRSWPSPIQQAAGAPCCRAQGQKRQHEGHSRL